MSKRVITFKVNDKKVSSSKYFIFSARFGRDVLSKLKGATVTVLKNGIKCELPDHVTEETLLAAVGQAVHNELFMRVESAKPAAAPAQTRGVQTRGFRKGP